MTDKQEREQEREGSMNKSKKFERPEISYHAIRHAWFNYAGIAYPVISAPADIFSSAVLAKAPNWRYCASYCYVLKQAELDYSTRWWLLNCLADGHKAIRLYESREAAEQACREQVAG